MKDFDDFQKEPSDSPEMTPCFCVGPQNGDPACPCEMKTLKVKNGRYVKEIDYGPVDKRKLLTEDKQ